MGRLRQALLGAMLTLGSLAVAAAAQAQISDDMVKVGVLTDMSGLYADLSGPGSVEAARMAIEDVGGAIAGKKIEMISGDHQNKADLASSIARQWFDTEKVDVIADVPNSAAALAVQEITREKNKVALFSAPATSDLTGARCAPTSFHWTFDTYALAHGTGTAIVKHGGDTWFFIVADYAFGQALARDTGDVVKANGGSVVGEVRHPIGTADFSSYLLAAQASKAKIVGLANAGGDVINTVKQAAEFGIVKGGQNLAGLLLFVSDVHSLGLETAQGIQLTSSFYWDLNDDTRAWSKRFFERTHRMPTMPQAGVYTSLMHYFRAVQATGTDDGLKVAAKMHETPINDFMTKNGRVREDGRVVRDFYLFQVKQPAESKYPWDYYQLISTIPADQAIRPVAESQCPLLHK